MTVVKRRLKQGCVRGVLGFRLQGWWDESLGEVVWGLVVLLRGGFTPWSSQVQFPSGQKAATASSLRTDCREQSGVYR